MKMTAWKVSMNTLLSMMVAGVLVFAPFVPHGVFAQDSQVLEPPKPLDNLKQSAQGFSGFFGLDYEQQTLPVVVGRSLQIVLSILGVIFLILVVQGGIMWMVAEGAPAKVEKARGLLFHAVLGLAITLSAFAITSFVLSVLTKATS